MKNYFNSFKQLPIYLKFTLGISLLLFILSLTQPAFYIDRIEDPDAYSNSLVLFLLGWMSFLGGAFIPFIIWLANPLYIIAIFSIIKSKFHGIYFALGATGLAFIFSRLNTIITKESGSSSIITERGLGFNLWFASFIILTLGLTLHRVLTTKI